MRRRLNGVEGGVVERRGRERAAVESDFREALRNTRASGCGPYQLRRKTSGWAAQSKRL